MVYKTLGNSNMAAAATHVKYRTMSANPACDDVAVMPSECMLMQTPLALPAVMNVRAYVAQLPRVANLG
jgi:hypothetical protein